MDIVDASKIVEWISSIQKTNAFDYFLKGIFIYVGALWLAVIIWVARDSINRSSSLLFQVFAISLNIILPVFGLILYLIIRPGKTLSQKYYEDLEYKMLEESGLALCPFCEAELEKEFLYCPECTKQVKRKCDGCHKPYDVHWELCPYCGKKTTPKKDKKSVRKQKTKETASS